MEELLLPAGQCSGSQSAGGVIWYMHCGTRVKKRRGFSPAGATRKLGRGARAAGARQGGAATRMPRAAGAPAGLPGHFLCAPRVPCAPLTPVQVLQMSALRSDSAGGQPALIPAEPVLASWPICTVPVKTQFSMKRARPMLERLHSAAAPQACLVISFFSCLRMAATSDVP